MRRFSSKGSPTCTLGRLASSSAASDPPNPAEASTLTPPMPSRPVEEPSRTARLPGTGRLAEHQALGREHPEAQHVDQRILCVAGVEGELAADGRDPDGIAVAGDPGDDALDQPLLLRLGRVAEEQRVHDGDGPGTHGEDVAEDAAHAGGRPLVRLDGRRVVVGLDPDGHGDAVAGVDDPGVLARADQHVGGLRGQAPQVHPRRLVGAVLAPHDGEQRQLEVVGLPSEDADDLVALPVGQPEGAVQRHPGSGRQFGRLVSGRVHGAQRTRTLPARRCPARPSSARCVTPSASRVHPSPVQASISLLSAPGVGIRAASEPQGTGRPVGSNPTHEHPRRSATAARQTAAPATGCRCDLSLHTAARPGAIGIHSR